MKQICIHSIIIYKSFVCRSCKIWILICDISELWLIWCGYWAVHIMFYQFMAWMLFPGGISHPLNCNPLYEKFLHSFYCLVILEVYITSIHEKQSPDEIYGFDRNQALLAWTNIKREGSFFCRRKVALS